MVENSWSWLKQRKRRWLRDTPEINKPPKHSFILWYANTKKEDNKKTPSVTNFNTECVFKSQKQWLQFVYMQFKTQIWKGSCLKIKLLFPPSEWRTSQDVPVLYKSNWDTRKFSVHLSFSLNGALFSSKHISKAIFFFFPTYAFLLLCLTVFPQPSSSMAI